jgi:serine/threonine protein kinase/Tfp pilus assembly protein PilF
MSSDQWTTGDRAEQTPLGAGTLVGVYRLESRLGEGGMGTVYRAADTKLNRSVAIKFLSGKLADASARRRFQREAQMVSSLNHPHILTVHDAGEFEGRQYLVTEFVDGSTLKEWVRERHPSWRAVVELLTGVADGLAAAHGAGILHRDIKPQNILVAKNGYAKLADFGLAKFENPSALEDATQTLTEGRTRPGTVLGTVAYMSPEQASARPVDARSDIFSFGIVLYEALSGHRPFETGSNIETLRAIIREPAPPLDNEIPPGLRAVVEKTLEKDPAERYQTMRDMVVDLRRLTRVTEEVTAPTKPVKLPRSKRWIVAAAIVMLVASGVAMWQRSLRAFAGGPIRSIAVLPLQNFSGDASQDYFSDGTTEELISNLAQIHTLKVISRTSVMRYKGSPKSLPDIGRELGADAIIEGSVHHVGGRVRITAQLIRASTDAHLWAKDYEGEMADMLRLEADVAQSIAREIRAQLTPEESARISKARRIDPVAQDEFLMGTSARWKSTSAEFLNAIRHFDRAIQIQPDYAEAYAGKSNAIMQAGFQAREAEARDLAQKALALDAKLSDAHAAMGRVYAADWDWANADKEYQQALDLNPVSLDVCQCYPIALSGQGRFPEAVAITERAVSLNPLSSEVQASYGEILFYAHKYEEARPHLERAIDLDPRNFTAFRVLTNLHDMSSDLQKAMAVWKVGAALIGQDAEENSAIGGRLLAKMGRRADARRVLSNVTKPGATPNLQSLATLYFALGNKDQGFATLARYFVEDRQNASVVAINPLFDDVRADPRFKALIAKLKLPGQR